METTGEWQNETLKLYSTGTDDTADMTTYDVFYKDFLLQVARNEQTNKILQRA